jgi:hypothetical protein
MALTPQQEQDLAPVVYEWNMLVAAAERVKSALDSGDQLLTNLLLEAFVVHFRQLGNFFFTSPEKGDLNVGHFLGGQSWKAVTGRRNRWDDLLVRANKQVAHLTAERHFKPDDKQKQQWPVSRLVGEVGEELQVFCDRTGFAGFLGIVPSTGVPVVDTGSSGSLSAEKFITTTATNAPTVCNSVAVNRTVNENG